MQIGQGKENQGDSKNEETMRDEPRACGFTLDIPKIFILIQSCNSLLTIASHFFKCYWYPMIM